MLNQPLLKTEETKYDEEGQEIIDYTSNPMNSTNTPAVDIEVGQAANVIEIQPVSCCHKAMKAYNDPCIFYPVVGATICLATLIGIGYGTNLL
jgi:hypothetical protein